MIEKKIDDRSRGISREFQSRRGQGMRVLVLCSFVMLNVSGFLLFNSGIPSPPKYSVAGRVPATEGNTLIFFGILCWTAPRRPVTSGP